MRRRHPTGPAPAGRHVTPADPAATATAGRHAVPATTPRHLAAAGRHAPRRAARRGLRIGLTLAAAGAVVAAGLVVPSLAAAAVPYEDATLPVATRVADLLSRMTLDEKIGQMTQAERGSVTNADITTYRLGSLLSGGGSGPATNNATAWANMYDNYQNAALATPLRIPMIYGSDAVHGHNNVVGATIFPHNIGLGATRNPALMQQIGRATAEEVTGTGVDWTFAPCLCVARNDRWGRTYESFGEKPELPVQLATVINGLQGTSLNASGSVLATAKHYVGDGGTTGGDDQGNTQISEAELRAIHLPPFAEAVRRGVGSVMISYSSWNGQKLHGHSYLINDVLKRELGFTGFVVSDWNGIDQIDGAPDFTAAEVRQAVNAGIDMVMVPTAWRTFITLLRAEVQAGRVTMARIDDANRRILTKKFELGMFERPLADRSYTGTVGSAAHRSIARQAVRESQVLLKNQNNILPLAKSGNRIFVAGKSADNIGNQSGGWTVSWQGSSGNITPGTTILQGIRNAVGSASTVTYNANGTGINNTYSAAIAVVGETPYAEGEGDRPSGMGLDATDLQTISTLRAAGVPVIVVLVSGRPLDIASQLPNWNALLASWLPGTEGAGVADVLFGDHAPTGKLPVTWMQSASQQPINDGDGKPALFPYGYGLTYAGTVTPPTRPGTPTASSVTTTSAALTWAPSTSAAGSVSYRVYREAGTTDVLVASPTSASTTVTGLTAGTSYQFYVVAVDPAGTVSAASTPVTVTTSTVGDTVAPTQPGTPTASSVTATSAALSWTGSTDNVGVTGYTVYREAGATDVAVATSTTASATVTGLTGGTSYQFYVVANDAAGNRSTASAPVTVTTTRDGDIVAPTRPGTPVASAITATSATLTWAPSTDNVGVTGYGVYRIDAAAHTLVGTVTGTSYTATGLTAGSTYRYYVVANDAAGARSVASDTVTFTTTGGATASCAVTYSVNDWGSGFTGNVTIRNTGTAPVNGWTLGFSFAGNQRVSQGWSGTWLQTGANVTVRNESWNGSIAPNAAVTAGFNGTYSGSNPRPTAFTLNGAPCTVG